MTSEATRGVRLPRGQRRQQLLTAAQAVFVESGFHSASMDVIAARAGVTKPVLYQHFGSKRDLYLAVLDAGAKTFLETMQIALEDRDNNRERVQAAIGAYLDFMSREDGGYRLIFESDLFKAPDVRERVERVEEISAGMVAKVIAEDTGLSDDEASLLAYGLLGLAQSAAQRYMISPGHLDKEAARTILSALAWRGISGFPKSHPPRDPVTPPENLRTQDGHWPQPGKLSQ